jgi:hypothetical protein
MLAAGSTHLGPDVQVARERVCTESQREGHNLMAINLEPTTEVIGAAVGAMVCGMIGRHFGGFWGCVGGSIIGAFDAWLLVALFGNNRLTRR